MLLISTAIVVCGVIYVLMKIFGEHNEEIFGEIMAQGQNSATIVAFKHVSHFEVRFKECHPEPRHNPTCNPACNPSDNDWVKACVVDLTNGYKGLKVEWSVANYRLIEYEIFNIKRRF